MYDCKLDRILKMNNFSDGQIVENILEQMAESENAD